MKLLELSTYLPHVEDQDSKSIRQADPRQCPTTYFNILNSELIVNKVLYPFTVRLICCFLMAESQPSHGLGSFLLR